MPSHTYSFLSHTLTHSLMTVTHTITRSRTQLQWQWQARAECEEQPALSAAGRAYPSATSLPSPRDAVLCVVMNK